MKKLSELQFLKGEIMKVKNPIRAYLHYNGSEMVAIASEPAGKAILHYGKLAGVNMLLGIAVGVVAGGVAGIGYKIYDKIEEKKLEKLKK